MMYDVAESRSYLEPSEGETIGFCAECGQDIFAGADIWEMQENWYCGHCIESFKKQAEKENYFEDAV